MPIIVYYQHAYAAKSGFSQVSLTNRLQHPRIYATIKNYLQHSENGQRGGGTWAPNVLLDGRCSQAWKHGFAPTIGQVIDWISTKARKCTFLGWAFVMILPALYIVSNFPKCSRLLWQIHLKCWLDDPGISSTLSLKCLGRGSQSGKISGRFARQDPLRTSLEAPWSIIYAYTNNSRWYANNSRCYKTI